MDCKVKLISAMFRLKLMGLLFSVVFLTGCSVPPPKPVPNSEVATESGIAQGVTSDARVVRWLDIPYAQAPVGGGRWRAPRALEPTLELIQPQKNDILCPQMPSETSGIDADGPIGQEDCLYLDIVAPADYRERSYPVMFWIHGGGNTSGRKGTYDFTELAAREEVVVVTINYRLGPLGWITHEAIQDSAEGFDKTSNFGTLDIISALEWTHRNISSFGGQMSNVTVFGESAGGHNIYALLASPLADGLFHKAIAQSGYTTDVTPRQAINHAREFIHIDRGSWELTKALGLPESGLDAQALRAVSMTDLITTYYALEKDHLAPLTTADGIVIPEEGIAAALGSERSAKRVPVLAGSNRDEVSLWLGLNRYFVESNDVSLGLLPPKMTIRDPAVYSYWVSIRSQGWKARGIDSPLRALEAAGYTDLYAYRFDWDEQADNWLFPFSKILGASHGAEIAFVMGSPMYGSIGDYMYPDTESAAEMTSRMMGAWGKFAREGSPGSVAGTPWPPFSRQAPHTMVLDSGESVRIEAKELTLDALLQAASAPSPLSAVERCLLTWELLINIGRPEYSEYARWNDGECAALDPRQEKRKIQSRLVSEYGSATLP